MLFLALLAVVGIKPNKATQVTQATEVPAKQPRALFGQRRKRTLGQATQTNAN